MFGLFKAIGRVLLPRDKRQEHGNKWAGLDRGPGYRIEDLGRPAVFYIPADKLHMSIGGHRIDKVLEQFLAHEFGGFSTSVREHVGVWRDGKQLFHYDKCVVFEVSFVGKDRIPKLASVLGMIALVIGEKCIYFKAGQYSGLIWPMD